MFNLYCSYLESSSPLTIKEWCTIIQDNVDFMYSTMEAGGRIISVSALSAVH